MTSQPSVFRRFIAGALVAIPLLAGAAFGIATGSDPADTWSTGEQAEGAPANVDDSALVDARRATGEASSQAGFLVGATKELTDGTSTISGRSEELTSGLTAARDGSGKLSNGMTELQAATGQLGDGAVKVADGVEQAVNQVVGFEVVRGQIVGMIDRFLADLKNAKDPDSVQLREQLTQFRQQATSFQLDENIRRQLEEIRDGSREIANQLDTPGFEYHDGIYSATNAARELNDGLNQLQTGVDQALASVGELEQGAGKIDAMAGLTKDKIGAIQRAMPITQAGTVEAEAAGVSRTLAPMYAFLIAAAVLVGAMLRGRERRLIVTVTILGLSVGAAGLSFMLGAGLQAAQVGGIAVVAALLAFSSMVGTVLLRRMLGETTGAIVAVLSSLIQVGVVGWAWNLAATSTVNSTWMAVASVMPLNYPTAAIASLGNSGAASSLLIVSVAVLVAVCLAQLVSLKFVVPVTSRSSSEQ